MQAHDLLDGGHNGEDYFVRRLQYLVATWNIKTSIKILRLPDYKTYDIPLLRRINNQLVAQKKPVKYKLLEILPASKRLDHGFHFKWEKDRMLEGGPRPMSARARCAYLNSCSIRLMRLLLLYVIEMQRHLTLQLTPFPLPNSPVRRALRSERH